MIFKPRVIPVKVYKTTTKQADFVYSFSIYCLQKITESTDSIKQTKVYY